jgi:hypothetical protein
LVRSPIRIELLEEKFVKLIDRMRNKMMNLFKIAVLRF